MARRTFGDVARFGSGPPRRRWVPALAAASIAVLGGAIALSRLDTPVDVTTSPNHDLLVRDGDYVELTGRFIATPDRSVRYCPPVPMALPGVVSHAEPARRLPVCPRDFVVTVKGLDLTRLSDLTTVDGTRYGDATIRGVWQDRTIDVREQTSPPANADVTNGGRLPCAQRSDDHCVARGSATTARLIDAGSQLRPLAQDPRNGVQSLSGAGTNGLDGPIKVTLTVVDERLLSEFERIGLDLVQLRPAVRPVG